MEYSLKAYRGFNKVKIMKYAIIMICDEFPEYENNIVITKLTLQTILQRKQPKPFYLDWLVEYEKETA